MATCTFVRKTKDGYEYGESRVNHAGTNQETPTYHPAGVARSYEEALAANNMALSGAAPGRRIYNEWRLI